MVVLIIFMVLLALCRAAEEENDIFGKDTSVSFLENSFKFLIIPPENLVQEIQKPTEITCEIVGPDDLKISWLTERSSFPNMDQPSSSLNGIDMSSSSSIARVRAIFIIDHILQEPTNYTCIGISGKRSLSASTIVHPPDKNSTLKGNITFENLPARIIYTHLLHMQVIGFNVMLPCRVANRPPTTFDWYFLGKDLEVRKRVERTRRFDIMPTGDLRILNLKWIDMGHYQCVATNLYGNDSILMFMYPVVLNT